MADAVNRADPILVALRIPSAQRTKKDLLPIIEFVRGLKFFHSFSQYPHTVEAIASHLNLHSFYSGQIIFSEGDPGDLFYIILDGEVTISKRKKLHSLIDFVTENVVLVKLGVGKYFGETALESQEGLRTATATASKPSNLLSLNRDAYQTILLQLKMLLRGAVCRTLSSPSSIFHHVSAEIIDRLSELVVIRSFGLQDEIFSAGRKVNSLMVVKTGIVKLIKSVSKSQMEQMLQSEEAKFAPPDPESFRNLSQPATPATSLTPADSPQITSRTPRSPEGFKSVGKLKSPRSAGRNISKSPAWSPAGTRSSTPTKPAVLNYSMEGISNGFPVIDTSSPSSSPNRQQPTKLLRPSTKTTQKPAVPQDTPMGYWVLTRSDTYIETSRSRRAGDNSLPTRRSLTGEQLDFTVAVLMPGQVCGETALLDPEFPSPISAVAATAVELYCFDTELLFALGIHRDQRIMNSLIDDWKFRNPPQHEILKQLCIRYKWERKKEGILRQMKQK